MSHCVIEGCGKPRAGWGWCRTHYMRWSRTGDPLVTRKLANGTHHGCTVPGCEKPHVAHGYCEMHHLRVRKHGDPNARGYATGPRPQMSGARNHQWKGDGCGYDGAHDRVKASRGLADQFGCAHCDQPAAEWSYDHADPNEQVDGFPYSLDVEHYQPLCVKCHRGLDNGRRKKAAV
jgi:hypothetical protein